MSPVAMYRQQQVTRKTLHLLMTHLLLQNGHDVAGCDVSPTTSDEDDAAFADDPLAVAEWTA